MPTRALVGRHWPWPAQVPLPTVLEEVEEEDDADKLVLEARHEISTMRQKKWRKLEMTQSWQLGDLITQTK